MDVPPLTLEILDLSPPACLPTHHAPPPLTPVPDEDKAIELPPLPAKFSFSPSPHYPAPFGTMSLGETFRVRTRLSNTNTSREAVMGVKMMIELQGPNGRFKLGEIVHSNANDGEGNTKAKEGEGGGEEEQEGEPELAAGDGVEMDVGAEMKDVGVNLLICSVAWETAQGRKTFQRFFKFNVTPPLAIKTRVHSPTSPSILLDPAHRSDIHLEVLVQNTSMAGLLFDKVVLEPVKGLVSRPTTTTVTASSSSSTLFPDDTRQYLFTLSPSPDSDFATTTQAEAHSVFPPSYTPGTILPLGRLDVAWFSAPYRSPGRLQTSTLNRRVPAGAAGIGGRPANPTRASTTAVQTSSVDADGEADEPAWEYDLVLTKIERQVEIESQFGITLRVAARRRSGVSDDTAAAAPAPRLGLQYLSHPPAPASVHSVVPSAQPRIALSPPSRSFTPIGNRPFSPSTTTTTTTAGPSRPMTPVSSQLRQATSSTIGRFTSPHQPIESIVNDETTASATFPPLPLISTSAPTSSRGQVTHLGCSLVHLPPNPCVQVAENMGTTYTEHSESPPLYWETVHEHTLRFIALDEGMCDLGGIRVLMLDDEGGLSGSVAREWETLGDVWVTD